MKKKILLFMTVMCLCMTMFCGVSMAAEHNVPSPYEVMKDNESYPYAIIEMSPMGYGLTLYDTRPFFRSSNIQHGRGMIFMLENGEWVYKYTTDFGGEYDYVEDWFVWTSHDILMSGSQTVAIAHDPDFFPIPLHQVVMMLTEGELATVTLPAMVKTMGLLTACGVGLMALLMALPLLKNKFSHFLP